MIDTTGYVALDESERHLSLEKLPEPGESLIVAPLPSPTAEGAVSSPSPPTSAKGATPLSSTSGAIAQFKTTCMASIFVIAAASVILL